jgi:voltage-gated potassium channel
MARKPQYKALRRLIGAAAGLCIIVVLGALGYWLLSGQAYSLFDCVYMAFITITTIGFSEVIDVAALPGGRLLTMSIALTGIATVAYLLSNFTAFIIEAELSETFRRNAMENKARKLKDHYIVCGLGRVGLEVVQELCATQRPCVVVDLDRDQLKSAADSLRDLIALDGDATDNDVLLAAGIHKARGLFAVINDDNHNLVICLTAKQLNPRITVVARCRDLRNADKLRAAGADHVVSPAHIGGMRMASEMIRPTVVSFLDIMLRDKDRNLRIEEVEVAHPGHKIADLHLHEFAETLLLAVRTASSWVYNPPPDHVLEPGSRLVVMTTPHDRAALERHVGPTAPATEE